MTLSSKNAWQFKNKSFLTAYYNRKKKKTESSLFTYVFLLLIFLPDRQVSSGQLETFGHGQKYCCQWTGWGVANTLQVRLQTAGERREGQVWSGSRRLPVHIPVERSQVKKIIVGFGVFVFFFNVKDNLFTHVNICFINACFDSVKTIDTGLNLRSYLNNCRTLYTKEIKIHERVNFICKMKSTFWKEFESLIPTKPKPG